MNFPVHWLPIRYHFLKRVLELKFTKRNIDTLDIPVRDCFVWDNDLHGFGLRLSPRGRKTFVVQYRVGRRNQRVTIGSFGVLTVDQARKDAKILLGEIASGKSPALTVKNNRTSPTLTEINKRFVKEHIEVRLKPTTQSDYCHSMRKYILPVLGNRTVMDVCHSDVVKLHLDLKHIPFQANRVVGVLSKLFNLCEQWGLRKQGSNPCMHVRHYKEPRRNRYLDKVELERLWAVLETAHLGGIRSLYAVRAYKLLILTGCRLGEIRTMKWDYIKGTRVEFPDTKTGYKRIPLNDEAMEVLRQTPRKHDNAYVICGSKVGQPIVNLQKTWRKIRILAKLEDVRIHDLRHTFASHAVMGGTPLALVSQLLGHTQIATTMRYAHLADEELAKASQGIGELVGSNSAQLKDNRASHLKVVK